MPAFRRVEDCRAGPAALGILVPPGRRTLVILRPRALSWDLLALAAGAGSAFRDFDRDEAAGVARRVQRALDQAVLDACNPVALLTDGDGFQVHLNVVDYVWVACERRPGRPYEPTRFHNAAEAQTAVEHLAAVLWPGRDAEQEYYFNTQHFGR